MDGGILVIMIVSDDLCHHESYYLRTTIHISLELLIREITRYSEIISHCLIKTIHQVRVNLILIHHLYPLTKDRMLNIAIMIRLLSILIQILQLSRLIKPLRSATTLPNPSGLRPPPLIPSMGTEVRGDAGRSMSYVHNLIRYTDKLIQLYRSFLDIRWE